MRARLQEVLRAEGEALCELRLDALKLSPTATLDFLASLPSEWVPRLILTLRHRRSGPWADGDCDWDTGSWVEWWTAAMQMRPWHAVDLDWFAEIPAWAGVDLRARRSNAGAKRIYFSYHGAWEELASAGERLVAEAEKRGTGIKVAVPVSGPPELARLARFARALPLTLARVVVAMGEAGRAWRWSRLAGEHTYFAFDREAPTAPGQDDWREALPYFAEGSLPRLFVLWGANPKNRYGERRWNEIFRARGIPARYVALACQDPFFSEVPDAAIDYLGEKAWAAAAVEWMEMAGVEGASVTQPFKTYFAQLAEINAAPSVNTIYRDPATGRYAYANTDGPAVAAILRESGIPLDARSVLVIGGGGAGEAVANALGPAAVVWRRNHRGELDSAPLAAPRALVSTWPPEHGVALVDVLDTEFARNPEFRPRLLVDAQFVLSPDQAPLARFCRNRGIAYVPGTEWWARQARGQAALWLERGNGLGLWAALEARLPSSKSETLRALALAVFLRREIRILAPAHCADTENFVKALAAFGLTVEDTGDAWIARARGELAAPETTVFVGESAAALRFLGALSTALPSGATLRLDGAPQLRARPVAPLFTALGIDWDGTWPLKIPTGLGLPRELSLDSTSQIASGFLLAAAVLAKDGADMGLGLRFRLTGALRSLSYVRMTGSFLENCGFQVTFAPAAEDERAIAVTISATGEARRESPLALQIERDESGLAFLATVIRYLGVPVARQANSRQGDAVFASLLARLVDENVTAFSLADAPDLAPPLAAAALLFNRDLDVHSTPHLRAKESDRVGAIVLVARALGAEVREAADGFFLRGSTLQAPPAGGTTNEPIVLPDRGDHRIAMLIGALSFRWHGLVAEHPACVEKSFPGYWDCLRFLREALP